MIDPQDVTAVLVTRGDVDMDPIIETLPYGEIIVWDNSKRPTDEKVWGRYLAIAEATNAVIFFQDDDCIVHHHQDLLDAYEPGVLVGTINGDDPVRVKKYHDTTLLGWGAIFDWYLPSLAFSRYSRVHEIDDEFKYGLGAEIVFPMLTPSRSVVLDEIDWLVEDDAEVQCRANRMWRQPSFYTELDFWLTRARDVRDRLPT